MVLTSWSWIDVCSIINMKNSKSTEINSKSVQTMFNFTRWTSCSKVCRKRDFALTTFLYFRMRATSIWINLWRWLAQTLHASSICFRGKDTSQLDQMQISWYGAIWSHDYWLKWQLHWMWPNPTAATHLKDWNVIADLPLWFATGVSCSVITK